MTKTLIEAMLWAEQAIQDSDLKGSARHVFLNLILHWNTTGRKETFFCADSELARRCAMCRRTVYAARKSLETAGFIRVESKGYGRPPAYNLLIEDAEHEQSLPLHEQSLPLCEQASTDEHEQSLPLKGQLLPLHEQSLPLKGQSLPINKKSNIRVNKSSTFFSKLVEVYPRVSDKEMSEVKSLAAEIPEKNQNAILDAIDNLKHSDSWRDGGGKFIPGLSKFLKEERWRGHDQMEYYQLNEEIERVYWKNYKGKILRPGWREVVAALKGVDVAEVKAGAWREYAGSDLMKSEYVRKRDEMIRRAE